MRALSNCIAVLTARETQHNRHRREKEKRLRDESLEETKGGVHRISDFASEQWACVIICLS
jgi:hypothetical protein